MRLPLFNVTIERRIVTGGVTRMEHVDLTTLQEEVGVWTAEVPTGELVFLAEAPDHRGLRGEVDVPRSDSAYEAEINLPH